MAVPAPEPKGLLARADVAFFAVTFGAVALGYVTGTFSGAGAALPVRPHLTGSAVELLSIFGQNALVVGGLSSASSVSVFQRRWSGNTIDVVAVLAWLPTALAVGVVASHPDGPRLLLHAPIELAAVSLSASWWFTHRSAPPAARLLRRRLCLVLALLMMAALVETFVVPHRPGA